MSQSGDAPNTLTLHYRDLYGIIFVYFRFRFSIASAQSIPFVSYTYVDVLYSHQHIGFSFYRLVCAYYQAERFRGRAFVLRKSYFKLRTQSFTPGMIK